LAQQERQMISQRTKDGLASIKRRLKTDGEYKIKTGKMIKRLGNPKGGRTSDRGAIRSGHIGAQAAAFAADIQPIVADISSQGIVMVRGIADELNARETESRRGGRWNGSSIALLLRRLATDRCKQVFDG
jgi:DNA invertase Pin-like site-specific DNA recombinase